MLDLAAGASSEATSRTGYVNTSSLSRNFLSVLGRHCTPLCMAVEIFLDQGKAVRRVCREVIADFRKMRSRLQSGSARRRRPVHNMVASSIPDNEWQLTGRRPQFLAH